MWVLIVQTLQDDGISTLGVAAYLAVRTSEDGGHALAGGVELANSQKLVLYFLPIRHLDQD